MGRRIGNWGKDGNLLHSLPLPLGEVAERSEDGEGMSATQQASEQQTGDAAYEQIFQMPVPQTETQFRDIPIGKLRPFFTADIGFHPYPHNKLEAFAEELKENGLYERILVRPIAGTDEFEILAGHNRTAAAKLAG